MQNKEVNHKDISSLGQLRDELKVQAHLFKAEVKDEWKKLEKDWHKLKVQMLPAKQATKKSSAEIRTASKGLVKTIKKGYEQIKESLPA